MKRNLFFIPLALLTFFSATKNVHADEVWDTEEYQVIYQEDREDTAVWTYGDGRGAIFIEGLAGEINNRGSYNGYWVQESSSLRCETPKENIDGELSYHWGRFDITFTKPDFPSTWQAKFGVCDRPTTITLNGTPVTQETSKKDCD